MISTQVPAMVPNDSAMRRPQLNPFAIRHTPGEVRVNALVPRAATSARERLATRRQGRFARTTPSTRRTFPRIPAVTKRTLPASNGSARPTGYANPRRRELTKVRVRPWVPSGRGRCSRSVKRSSRSRSTVSLARIVVAIAPSAGTETSRTPRVTLRWAVTGRRPTRSGRSVRQTATVQRSSSIRRRAPAPFHPRLHHDGVAGLRVQRDLLHLRAHPEPLLRNRQRPGRAVPHPVRARKPAGAIRARALLRHRRPAPDDHLDLCRFRDPAGGDRVRIRAGLAHRHLPDGALVRGVLLRLGGGELCVSDGERAVPGGAARA